MIDYERLGKLLIEYEIAYNAWVKWDDSYSTSDHNHNDQLRKSRKAIQDAITDEMEKITYVSSAT